MKIFKSAALAVIVTTGLVGAAFAQGMAAPKPMMAAPAKTDSMTAPKDGMAMAKPMAHKKPMKHDGMKHDSMKSGSMAAPTH